MPTQSPRSDIGEGYDSEQESIFNVGDASEGYDSDSSDTVSESHEPSIDTESESDEAPEQIELSYFRDSPPIQSINPLHPKGLRAFPPDLRRMIFIEYSETIKHNNHCFLDMEETWPELVFAEFDIDLTEEIWSIFCEATSVILTGEDISRVNTHCATALKSKDMLLVRNPEADFA